MRCLIFLLIAVIFGLSISCEKLKKRVVSTVNKNNSPYPPFIDPNAPTTPGTPAATISPQATPVVNTPNSIPVPSVASLPPFTIPNNPTVGPISVANPDPNMPYPVIPCPTCPVKDTEIILIVDTSLSMANKQAMIQANIYKLINFFRPFHNVHITLVGSNNNCSEPYIFFNFDYGFDVMYYGQCVGSSNAVERLNQTLSVMPYSPNANMEAIIISDGNGYLGLNLASNKVRVSSIVSVPRNGLYCISIGVSSDDPSSIQDICSYEAFGFEYMSLSIRTNGQIYDLCNPNWALLLINLYNRMAI